MINEYDENTNEQPTSQQSDSFIPHPKLCYIYSQTCDTQPHKGSTKWLLNAGGCLAEVNISTNFTFRNILFGCLRQVGCLIEVTANSGLTVVQFMKLRLLECNGFTYLKPSRGFKNLLLSKYMPFEDHHTAFLSFCFFDIINRIENLLCIHI